MNRAATTLLPIVLLVLLSGSAAGHAQEPQTPAPAPSGEAVPPAGAATTPPAGGADPWAALGLPPAGASGAGQAATGDDPWGFEAEATEESWSDILRPQATDLALMSLFFAFAMFSFFRRSQPLKYGTLALSVAYLGVTKSTLISVTDIFRFVHWDFPEFKYSIAWYLIGTFTVVTTLLWGRLYCGRICAFGALTQLLDAVVPKKFRVGNRRLRWNAMPAT